MPTQRLHLLPRPTRLAIAVIAAAVAIGGPGEAQAWTDVQVVGTTLSVVADSGHENRISVTQAGANIRVVDFDDVVAPGPGCVFVDSHTAHCPSAAIARGRVLARDKNDWVFTFLSVPVSLYGEDGDDALRGGTGDDYLDGGTGADAMFGDSGTDRTSYAAKPAGVVVSLDGFDNDGVMNERDNVSATIEDITGSRFDDTIFGSASDNVLNGYRGNDVLWGFDGADTFPTPGLDGADTYNGGAGVDHVTYTPRQERVVVQLDGMANDGELVAAEGDNVRLDVENVTGGHDDDALFGSTFDNRLDGARGNDLIEGRGGADTLIGDLGSDRMYGGFGNDRLEGVDGTGGNDWLDGQADADTCNSDAGDTQTNC
jgi:Ca2+-binding RTX toxin-like protein